MLNPTLAIATRGHHPDLSFRGAAAVVDAKGTILREWGNIETPVFGRSALKLIQALPLIESGAAEAYQLSPQEIALACSSHQGQPFHIKILEKWLQKLGKDERTLECGPASTPKDSSFCLVDPTSVLCNSCSGKHLGFITTALYRKETLDRYISRAHPVQKRVEHAIADMTGTDLLHAPSGEDNCGIPAFAIPLFKLARAMAHFANPSRLHYPRQKAIQSILEALSQNPELIAGVDRFDTKIMQATKGQVISKSGADGNILGIIPSLEVGIALKIDDGNRKASEVAFLAILKSLGCLEDEDIYEQLMPKVPILTLRGKTVGFYQPTHFTLVPAARERLQQ